MTDLNKAIADIASQAMDARVSAIVADLEGKLEALAAKHTPREIIVTIPERSTIKVGRQHEKFEALLRAVSADTPVWLAGPAGSGKTVAAEKVAQALEFKFSAVSIGPQTTQAHLFGYMDATGTYRGTEVRARFEHGGVLLLDEIDRGNPGVMTQLNALLANTVCAFPDGMIVRHADFRIIAAANTIGMGADRQYVGALQLDAATLDRFAVLDWPYDAAFEMELASALGGQAGADWCARVQKLRAAAEELKIRHVISPRATLNGIKLLQAQTPESDVEIMTVWRGLDSASKLRIMEHANLDGFKLTQKVKAEVQAEPEEHEDSERSGKTCPKCGKSEATITSRIKLGTYACWRKRGGCGHSWSISS